MGFSHSFGVNKTLQEITSELLPLAHELGGLKFPNTRAQARTLRYVRPYGSNKWRVLLTFQGRPFPIAVTDCLRSAQRLADLASLFFHRWQKKSGDPTRLNYTLAEAETDKDNLNEHLLLLLKMWDILRAGGFFELGETEGDRPQFGEERDLLLASRSAKLEKVNAEYQSAVIAVDRSVRDQRDLLLQERAAKLEEVNLWYRDSVNKLEKEIR